MSSSLRSLRPRKLCLACLVKLNSIPSRARLLQPVASRSVSTTSVVRRDSAPRVFIDPSTSRAEAQTERAKARQPPVLSVADFKPKAIPTPTQISRLVVNRIPDWTISTRTKAKLEAYGFEVDLGKDLLVSWARHVESYIDSHGSSSDEATRVALTDIGFDVQALILAVRDDNFGDILEAAFLRAFLDYSVSTTKLPSDLLTHIKTLLETTDLTRIAYNDDAIGARSLTRHFHLHIGPTNSGKTYNALKRLSTASSGAYAGPLRLLAHEVWERMNLGTVGGMTAGQGRACNLVTGEERRIVDPNAGLISCTVEMLPSNLAGGPYEVVVVDEIQMMGDSQRGGAWSSAVLSLQAKEIHLCGDETTVKLLEGIIESLGDRLTIHRYDRLTPLTVSEESLEGDWNKVEKGDCIVTFSRSNIFAVKKLVESTAGKKCAVVYGALPPETRADQARDFNDENGRAEVLVASDAVGMGLNLKIKRMIFESLHKYNGKTDVPLALTQIKQIAGRAGRYGLHKTTTPILDANKDPSDVDPSLPDEIPSPGGLVTTLHKVDLPILRSLLPLPLPSITRAVVDMPFETLATLDSLLPSTTTFAELLDHVRSLIKLPTYAVGSTGIHQTKAAELLEPYRRLLTLKEINTLCYSPVQLRDERSVAIFVNIVKAFSEQGQVHLEEIFGKTKLIETLNVVEDTLESLPPLPPIEGIGRRPLTPPILVSSIPQLEVLHKALVLYIWLSFRFDLSFLDRPHAMELKLRTEVVLDDCLERLPGLRNKKTHERGKEVDKSVRQWRREFVGPDGRRIELGKSKKGKEKRKQLSKMGKIGPSDEDEHGWVRDSRKEEVASTPDPDSIKWAGDRETSKRTKQGVWRNVAVLEQPSTETTSSSSSP